MGLKGRKTRKQRGASPRRGADRLITKAEAAELLGLTERRLEQLVAEDPRVPCVGRGKNRRFPWPGLREWRDRELVQQGVRSVRPQSIEEARARKLAAEADLAEMEAAERRGELMPTTLWRQRFAAACGRLRALLLNLPSRYGPQLLETLAKRLRPEDLRRIEDFLTRMVQETMAELEASDDVPEDEETEQGAA